MKSNFLSISIVTLLFSSFLFAEGMKKEKVFGGERDISYSQYLWGELEASKLNSIPATLYIGGPPHGAVREVLEGKIDGHRVIVKRNYGGEGVSVESVKKDRAKFLKAVTVMVKKEGFDAKNNDWYWAKYKADGTLHTTPKGDKIVGKFPGCIGCHQSASGGDLVFVHNKTANAEITLVDSLK
jgi:hypothetical protein